MRARRLNAPRTFFQQLHHLTLEGAALLTCHARQHPVARQGHGQEQRAPVELNHAITLARQLFHRDLDLPAATLTSLSTHCLIRSSFVLKSQDID